MIIRVNLPYNLVHSEDVQIFHNEVQNKPVADLFEEW